MIIYVGDFKLVWLEKNNLFLFFTFQDNSLSIYIINKSP